MTNNQLFYFTGKCLSIEEHPEFRKEFINVCQSDLIDWQHFVYLCSNHLILPAIYLKLRTHNLLEYLPEELSEHLKNIHELNVERNHQILEQLQHITEILNPNNIFPVFMKGSGNLLDGVYLNIGESIDFLVPEKDYFKAAKLFEDVGYTSTNIIAPFTDIADAKHYPRLRHPDFVATIEIHRLPVQENFLSMYNSSIIDQEKKEIESLPGCFVLSDKHKIIHNFIHSQLSNKSHVYGIISFRDLYDLYLLSKRSEIQQTLPFIKNKQKAIAYFVFAGEAFGLPGKFYPKANLSAWILLKKHTLNLKSSIFYHIHRTLVYFYWQIFTKYFGQIIKSFYSKKMRKSLLRRICNRHWYKTHLNNYTGFFAQKHN